MNGIELIISDNDHGGMLLLFRGSDEPTICCRNARLVAILIIVVLS